MYKLLPLILLVISQSAFAFINVESTRMQPGDGFFGNASAKASGQHGNTNKLTLDGSTVDIYRTKTDEVIGLLDYNYGTSEGDKDTNNAQAHLRYVFNSTKPHMVEIFTQYEFDQFKDLDSRELAGANIRDRLFHDADDSLLLGAGGFYELEDYTEIKHRQTVRGNFYLAFARKVDDRFNASATVFYQPSVTEFSDFRLRFQADLDVNLSKRLMVSLECLVDDENWVPSSTIIKTDSTYMAGLTFKY